MSRQGHPCRDRVIYVATGCIGQAHDWVCACAIGILCLCHGRIFVSRQGRGWDWATMGREKGFPCRDIVPLTSCCDKEIVSR